MRNRLKTIIVIIFFLFSKNVFSQSSCNLLITKIKNDSEWNLPNYYGEINRALKNNCNNEEKITLFILKAGYYGNVEQFENAITTINNAEILLENIRNKDSIQAIINLRKSGYYARLNNYSRAYQEWVKCNSYYTLTKNYDGMSYCQQILGMFFIQLKQKKYAKIALDRSSRYANINKKKKVLYDLYTSYSGYWGSVGNYDSSLYYFQLSERYEALKEINFRKDYNKGVIYLNKGDLSNSRLYFQESINKAEKVSCKGYMGVGYYGLAVSYLDEDNEKAFIFMKKALDLIDKNNPDLGINICECVLSSFTGEQYQKLLPFFEKRKLKFQQTRNKIDEAQVGKLLLMTSSSNEQLFKIQEELERKKEKENNQTFFITFFTIIGCFLIIISIVISIYYRKAIRTREILKKELEKQKNILAHSVITITNHNANTESLSSKLKSLALQQTSKKLSDELYLLAKNFSENATGSKSKELKDLDLMIQSINDGFVKNLCEHFENLTSNEITLAIYLRMNFSTKQIAELKGTSENSIDVSRSRLRNKLGIKGENIDLSAFLNRF